MSRWSIAFMFASKWGSPGRIATRTCWCGRFPESRTRRPQRPRIRPGAGAHLLERIAVDSDKHPAVCAAQALTEAAETYLAATRATPPPPGSGGALSAAEERVRAVLEVTGIERSAGHLERHLAAEDECGVAVAVNEALGGT